MEHGQIQDECMAEVKNAKESRLKAEASNDEEEVPQYVQKVLPNKSSKATGKMTVKDMINMLTADEISPESFTQDSDANEAEETIDSQAEIRELDGSSGEHEAC